MNGSALVTSLGPRGGPLLHTAVTPELAEPITQGTNLLYCSTFRLAWSELQTALHGPVRLQGDPPLALTLARQEAGPAAGDIDAASCVARAGVGPAFLAELRSALHRVFGERDDFMLPPRLATDAVLAYAYMSKDLVFRTPLCAEREFGLVFQNGPPVAHFGVWSEGDDRLRAKRAEQVVVHDFTDDGDFVLELATTSTDDRLIVARTKPRETLLATVEDALARAAPKPSLWSRLRGKTALGKLDVVRIPIIDLDVLREYAELAGRKIVGHDRVIEDAKQRIRFRLDEKGAILRSAGVVTAPRGPRGRSFVCDRPFLVALVRTGRKLPYFAAWVEDPELLVPTPTR